MTIILFIYIITGSITICLTTMVMEAQQLI